MARKSAATQRARARGRAGGAEQLECRARTRLLHKCPIAAGASTVHEHMYPVERSLHEHSALRN